MAPCLLLPGHLGVVIQVVLFVFSFGILVFKKYREDAEKALDSEPARSWTEFGLDSSKQCVGAFWIHILNLVFSILLPRFKAGGTDECEWYWINIMVDTTFGVVLEWLLLLGIFAALEHMLGDGAEDFRSGEYMVDGEIDMGRYTKQLTVWLTIVTLMKFVVLAIIWKASLLRTIAYWALLAFALTPRLKLVVVMVLTPVVMNSFQFWFVDEFIKKRDRRAETVAASGATADLENANEERQPLMDEGEPRPAG
eukprot:TRINITY_DN23496_c0_g1_i2.p1 TRINITY_DN23496_c0_g1~~TRINITY_DN23496_c0_g1_i2.p1  ORF type:complete len:253 (+),score=64.35 TRINITY_DN23496_c0_g1_i2:456-1214(+)